VYANDRPTTPYHVRTTLFLVLLFRSCECENPNVERGSRDVLAFESVSEVRCVFRSETDRQKTPQKRISNTKRTASYGVKTDAETVLNLLIRPRVDFSLRISRRDSISDAVPDKGHQQDRSPFAVTPKPSYKRFIPSEIMLFAAATR